ncbi:hypothetical protein C8R46DRAFT_889765 [Mycena filopes]|nr:hypothetical protein C8R46DRAFT_889765 [Mycena filopes]
MRFPLPTVVCAIVAAAAARHEDTYPLTVTKVVQLGQYNLTYWSDTAPIERPPTARAPTCGSNTVSCSNEHKATASICQDLVNNLRDNPNNNVGNSPRAICLGQSGNECCVGWSAPVGNMPQGDLFSAANAVFDGCTQETGVSGVARDVELDGVCVTQCLSNRATGCS